MQDSAWISVAWPRLRWIRVIIKYGSQDGAMTVNFIPYQDSNQHTGFQENITSLLLHRVADYGSYPVGFFTGRKVSAHKYHFSPLTQFCLSKPHKRKLKRQTLTICWFSVWTNKFVQVQLKSESWYDFSSRNPMQKLVFDSLDKNYWYILCKELVLR